MVRVRRENLSNLEKGISYSWPQTASKAVNNMKDKNGLSWSCKVMIRCGLSLGINGQWGVNQLSPELQEIIKKYPNEFAWIEEPDSASVEAEIVRTDSDAEKLD
jgi:hypothetical protein